MMRAEMARCALAGAIVLGACGGKRGATTPVADRPIPERLAQPGGEGAAGSSASADPNRLGGTRKPPARGPQGVELAKSIAPIKGFIDTPLAFDGAGGRVLYVNTDAAELAELVVHDVANDTEIARVDLRAFTTAPAAVGDFDGEHFVVFARAADGGMAAALIAASGKIARTYGPSTDVVRTRYDGEDAVAVYQRVETIARGKKPSVAHTVDVFSLASGKRLGKRTIITTDLAGFSERLDFRINHWDRGYTVAIGIKGGEYDRREDQRSPDVEGWFDVPRATFSRRLPIPDLVEHARRMQLLARHSNRDRFVAPSPDQSHLLAFTDEGTPGPVELAEPFRHYLRSSLVVQDATADAPLFFSLEIDPVHAAAVEKKRAVERWLDLYRLDPGATRATRVGRLPLEDGHPGYRWIARPGRWVVVPRHVGFERGGPVLQIYTVKGA